MSGQNNQEQPASDTEVLTDLGVKRRGRREPNWTPPEDAEMRFWASEGLSGSETATRMGRTRGAVVARAHRIGLSFQCSLERQRKRVSIGMRRVWAARPENERAAIARKISVARRRLLSDGAIGRRDDTQPPQRDEPQTASANNETTRRRIVGT